MAEFLRVRRQSVTPEDVVGLPCGERRRTAGLRREEVAMLAGVSVSWYTWLEQGRPINASPQVIEALGRAPPSRRRRARAPPPRRAPSSPAGRTRHRSASDGDRPPGGPSSRVRRSCSVHADVLAWNRARGSPHLTFETLAPDDRNLVWVMFVEPRRGP
ncbi:MAG: helix-turn-helix transcriptional regulator [Ilumatobacteraceae bacterium]